MKILSAGFAFVLVFAFSIASTGTMRCKTEKGSDLVSTGDSKFDVIAKCGHLQTIPNGSP